MPCSSHLQHLSWKPIFQLFSSEILSRWVLRKDSSSHLPKWLIPLNTERLNLKAQLLQNLTEYSLELFIIFHQSHNPFNSSGKLPRTCRFISHSELGSLPYRTSAGKCFPKNFHEDWICHIHWMYYIAPNIHRLAIFL